MKQKLNARGIAAVLVALFTAQASRAVGEVPVISGAHSEATGLRIDEDPQKKTAIRTDWELPMSVSEANDNGHALFYHGGSVYTYLDRYGGNARLNPVMRRYDASGDAAMTEEKELPFADVPEFWNGNNLRLNTVFQDGLGGFLFVFAISDDKLRIMGYDYETNTVGYTEDVTVGGNSAGLMMTSSSVALSRGPVSGSVFGDFELRFHIAGNVNKGSGNTCYYDMAISRTGSATSAVLGERVYDHGRRLEDGLRNVDFCGIDATHSAVSILFRNDKSAESDGISLFEIGGDGCFSKLESWTDPVLFPSISLDEGGKGDCFGLNAVRHDGHCLLVYAGSFAEKPEVVYNGVVYNVALWDDPSSFGTMRHIAGIKVPGKVSASGVYQLGMRQLAVQVPGGEALSRDGDYYAETTFFTYAPGAALARHAIITETDKVQTGITAVEAGRGLSLEGRLVRNSGAAPLAVYDAGGCLVAEYPAAAEVSLDGLSPGFYIIRSGADAVSAVLR